MTGDVRGTPMFCSEVGEVAVPRGERRSGALIRQLSG